MKKIILTLLLSAQFVHAASSACEMENYHQEVIDTAGSLQEIAQEDLLKGQCKKFRKEFKRRAKGKSKLTDKEYSRAKVLCGKDTFINLGMRTNIGIPQILLRAIEKFEEVGPKLSKLGFLNDESWQKKRWPFGIMQELGLDGSAKEIKVRRLKGIWTKKNLTSNGQIKGLDHLFCLNDTKRVIVDSKHTKTHGIHTDLCTNYTKEEREGLKEFLKHF